MRQKLNLNKEQWKEHRRELESLRIKKRKLNAWKKLVSEIVIAYVEGGTIEGIAQDLLFSDYRLVGAGSYRVKKLENAQKSPKNERK